MSSYLSKWDSNQRLEFEPQSHLNNPWPTSTVPFLRDFPNLRAMPQGLELLADSVLTPNYNVVRANPLYNLTPSTWNSLPDAWDYSARHGHQQRDTDVPYEMLVYGMCMLHKRLWDLNN